MLRHALQSIHSVVLLCLERKYSVVRAFDTFTVEVSIKIKTNSMPLTKFNHVKFGRMGDG